MCEGKGSHSCREWLGERKLLLSKGRLLLGKHSWLKGPSEGTRRRSSQEAAHVGDGVFEFRAPRLWRGG